MPQINSFTRKGVYANTTDATQTTAATIPTRPDKAYKVIARILAVETTDFDEMGDYMIEAGFLNDGGTLTISGSVRTLHTANETTLTGSVTMDADGTDIRVRVTGDAATNVTWLVDTEVMEVGRYLAEYGLGA